MWTSLAAQNSRIKILSSLETQNDRLKVKTSPFGLVGVIA